ncbi:MAG: hypothetical protein LUF33_00480 [Clostridiales bacterium]|nr:hypothetical protein [Clostridiales bacterium]
MLNYNALPDCKTRKEIIKKSPINTALFSVSASEKAFAEDVLTLCI